MANLIQVRVNQTGSTTSVASMRTHTVTIDRPTTKAGADNGAMGGELMLAGLGGCFMSNFLAAINARQADVTNVDISVEGVLESSPPHFSAISMRIRADYSDQELMEKLVTIAERGCIVANTLKNAVDLSVTIIENNSVAAD